MRERESERERERACMHALTYIVQKLSTEYFLLSLYLSIKQSLSLTGKHMPESLFSVVQP